MSNHMQRSNKQTETDHHLTNNAADLENEQQLESAIPSHEKVSAAGLGGNPNQVMRMQSLIGNKKTLQLLRKNQPQSKQVGATPFSFLNRPIQREPHALEQIESTDPDAEKPSQPLASGDKLTPVYAQAWEIAWTEYKPKVEGIAGRLKDATASVAPLKGRERAGQKAATDYDHDTRGLVDIARGSIICQTADDVVKAWELVNAEFKVVRVKNRFANPADGYRDLMLNVELSNNHVAELQLHLQSIIDVKNGDGHKLYERVRVLEAQKDLSPEEQEELDDKKAQMEGLYNEAWEKAKAIPDMG